MRLGRTLASVALAVLAVYGGVKYYVYYKTRATVQRFVEQVSPFVTVEYRGISSTLANGTIQIDDLQFRPQGISDTVYLRSFVVSVGNLPALLKAARQSEDKTPPTSASVALKGLSARLDGPLLQTVDRLLTTAATASGATTSVPHCGNQSQAGIGFLRRLGYEDLTLDVQMRYDARKDTNAPAVGLDVDIRDMSRVVVDMQFGGAFLDIADRKKSPPLREFTLMYKDQSYQDRLKRFCMQAAKLTEAQYLEAEIEHGMFFRQVGIVPGPGLRDAYREFLARPSAEVRVQAHPSEGFDPRGIRFYQPDEVLQQLSLTVVVNDKRIDDLSFSFGAPVAAAAPQSQEPAAVAAERTEPAMRAPRAARQQNEEPDDFRAVQVADLSRYVSYTVRLQERGQQTREGVLTQVTGTAALVERRYGSGNVVIKVPLANIVKAEVREP